MILVLLGAWLAAAVLTTAVFSLIIRGGALEDRARGYAQPGGESGAVVGVP
ncbi:hypothetical protein [Geodermatophilus sp. URMC 64]